MTKVYGVYFINPYGRENLLRLFVLRRAAESWVKMKQYNEFEYNIREMEVH